MTDSSLSRPVRVRPRVRDADRKRAAQACWRCRDRKSRCIVVKDSNGRDICQRCLRKGHECTFGPYPQTGLSSDADAQQFVPRDGGAHARRSPSPAYTSHTVPAKEASRATPRDGLPSSKSSPAAVHPNSIGQLVVKNPHQTHYLGDVANSTFISKVQDAVVGGSPEEAQRGISSNIYSQFDSNSSIDSEILQIALAAFPPRDVAEFLVTTFFQVAEANYYFMDRADFRARLDRYYQPATPDSGDCDPTFVCLALMVFAMGSQFAELRAPEESRPKSYTKHGPGMVFYTKAKLFLSDVIAQCSLESIQICFLIALFLLPSNISDLSYVYHGMALKMAISGGLHRQVGNTNLSERVLQVRNRLWWSLWASERRLTIILDRPESIHEEDIDAPLPEFLPELDQPESENNIANLKALVQLMKIFNRVVKIGKTWDFADKDAQPSIVEVRRDLDLWLKSLPHHLQLNNIDPEGSCRGAVHLHMRYNQIISYMGRAVLLRRIQRRLHGGEQAGPTQTDALTLDAYLDDPEEVLSRDCVAAAYRVVSLVRFMHDNKRLGRFSFNDMNCCTSASIIVVMHELLSPHPLHAASAESILACMAYMATGCENAKHSLRLIQNLQGVVAAVLRARSARGARPSAAGAGADGGAGLLARVPPPGYNKWESWMAEAEQWTTAASSPSAAGAGAKSTPGSLQAEGGAAPAAAAAAGASSSSLEAWRPFAVGGEDGEAGKPFEPSSLDPATLPGADDPTLGDLQSGVLYGWPDSWNSLGLGGFEGLELPGV